MSDKFRSLQYFRSYKTKSEKWNVAAMDCSGKFQFDQIGELFEKLECLVESDKKVSLVPFSRSSKCKLFFDIDALEKLRTLSWSKVQDVIIKFVEQHFTADHQQHQYILLKSQKYEKYHLYFPNIVVAKKNLGLMYSAMNALFKTMPENASKINVIDETLAKPRGFLIRFEGFEKFDKATGRYESGTDYVILHPKNEKYCKSFYQKIHLLVEESAPESSMKLPLFPMSSKTEERKEQEFDDCDKNEKKRKKKKLKHVQNCKNLVNINHNDNDHNNKFNENNRLFLIEEQDESSFTPVVYSHARSIYNKSNQNDLRGENQEEIFENDQEVKSDEESDEENDDSGEENDELAAAYPKLFAVLEEYPIRTGGISEFPNCIVFDLDKSEEGRFCMFTNKCHSSNNSYLIYFKNDKKLFRKCKKKECENAFFLIWKKDNQSDSVLSLTTDDGFSRSFRSIHGVQWIAKH